VDVKRESRKARGVSRPAAPSPEPPPTSAAEPTAQRPSGKSRWKHDLHRAFARVRLDIEPMLVHVWEVMWDHLPASNEPFPLSHGTIGRGIHRTAAARATAELERLGLLVCVRRGRLGSPDANIWRFPQSLPDIPKRERRKPPARPSA